MSKFIDTLNQVSDRTAQPLGFKATSLSSPRPKILLVARLVQPDIVVLADYVAGANAVLLPVSKSGAGAKIIQGVSQAVGDIPWGGWLKDASKEEIAQILKTGCDFVVFPVDTPLATIRDDEVGKILEVEISLDKGLLQAIDDLPIDAVLIASEQEQESLLTWRQLMHFRWMAGLLPKPLLAPIPATVTASEIEALWEAGVAGMVMEVGTEPGKLKELRQVIDKLSLSPRRKRRRPEALLPHVRPEAETEAEEEE